MLTIPSESTCTARSHLNRVAGFAEALPLRNAAFDAVLSFNALHHFGLDEFLRESARVLRSRGILIIYTRTPEQNRRTVWGQLFPGFAERETRLFEEDQLRLAVMGCAKFRWLTLKRVPWLMRTTVPRLIEQARGRVYSTLGLYDSAELEAATRVFERRLTGVAASGSLLTVSNDHLLVVSQRC
jgi:SAM-dependent methyltransferase